IAAPGVRSLSSVRFQYAGSRRLRRRKIVLVCVSAVGSADGSRSREWPAVAHFPLVAAAGRAGVGGIFRGAGVWPDRDGAVLAELLQSRSGGPAGRRNAGAGSILLGRRRDADAAERR